MKKKAKFKQMDAGEKMGAIGKVMIYCFTIPILAVVMMGGFGLVVGIISCLIGIAKLGDYIEEE